MTLAVAVVPEHALPRGCAGKRRYRSVEAAQEGLLRVVARFASGEQRNPRPARPMCVYPCLAGCGFFHIGHRPEAPEDRA